METYISTLGKKLRLMTNKSRSPINQSPHLINIHFRLLKYGQNCCTDHCERT